MDRNEPVVPVPTACDLASSLLCRRHAVDLVHKRDERLKIEQPIIHGKVFYHFRNVHICSIDLLMY